MNDQVSKSERLSALVDNETESFETRRLIDQLLRSEPDRKTWARYHLIGDSLRGGMRRTAPPDFLARVRSGIEDDQPLHVPLESATGPRWLNPAAGVGIAAAVAVVSLLGLQTMTGTGDGVPAATVDATTVQEPERTDLASDPDPRFAPYLENHAELVAPGSSAFARVRNSVDGE